MKRGLKEVRRLCNLKLTYACPSENKSSWPYCFIVLLSIFLLPLLFYWQIFRGGSIGFLSQHPKLKSQIDKEARTELETAKKEAVSNLDEIKRGAGVTA